MKYLILFCLLVFGFVGVSAQKERFFKPVDEAKNDASFLAFRTKLIAAVKKQDKNFLLSVVDRNIKTGFGGNDGIENFKKMWKLNGAKSEIWDELLTVLTNGGTFSTQGKNKSFYAPALFTEFPEDLDAFEYQAIFGNNVNLRAKPDLKADVIAQLSYNIVKVDYQNSVKPTKNSEEYSWLKIETLGGKKGFVNAQFVRSSIDYRAGFEKIRGSWKMTFFLAGD